MIEINDTELKRYLDGFRYPQYDRTVDIEHHLEFHFDGFDFFNNFREEDVLKNPDNKFGFAQDHHRHNFGNHRTEQINPYFYRLIDLNRPGENAPIKLYRRTVYKSITKRVCSKVINTLRKIPRSKDWRIDYSKSEKPSPIAEQEQLQVYTERKFPFYKSITNWFYQIGIRKMLLDPNGLFVVIPMNMEETDDTKIPKPIINYVPSRDVWDYVHGRHVVYQSDRTVIWRDDQGKEHEDFIIVLMLHENDITQIWEARRISAKNYELVNVRNPAIHMPVIRAGGEVSQTINNTVIYKSFIDNMLPSLDVAARKVSDLDAEMVQHIYSTIWYFEGQRCSVCFGTGKVRKEGQETAACTAENCSNGRILHTPFSDMVLQVPKAGEETLPTPPAGIIQKDVTIAKTLREFIDKDLADSLDAVNMSFLGEVPLNQSGRAKEVDKEDGDNFVYNVALHSVEHIFDKVYFFINEWRNGLVISSPEEREKMLPKISIPKRFDMINNRILAEEVNKALQGGVSTEITNEMQVSLAANSFPNNPEIAKKTRVVLDQDPLSGISVDEKISLKMAGDIKEEDFILSMFTADLVNIAEAKNEDFLLMEFEEQRVILLALAKERVEPKASQAVGPDPESEDTFDN